ncbi:DUF1642 domain-containing protein [Lacticaseibacillus paracasei]|uniref:DUF1642 domain-containing protein n=1 Tax=Lacticaseibacillus paracasei TaxID=1597 RepID=UPI00403F308A
MSEEKLYAVKNDEGKYFDCEYADFLSLSDAHGPTIVSEDNAKDIARDYGGHVVTLVEEPKKVVVSENEGKAIDSLISAETYSQASESFHYLFASRKKEDIKRIMKAFRNGYTVAKEKKYLVYKELGSKQKDKLFAQAYRSLIHPGTISWDITNEVKSGSWAQFTESEIEKYGLQDCEKEEVTDDGTK